MASLALAFDILARDKNATKTFNQVGRAAETAGTKGKRFGSLMSGAAKIAGGALAAAGIGELISTITGAVGDSIAEAREAQKVGRTTGAIIKATGGASKVTQKQVEALSGAISEKAGVDDEVIQSGANLLLTFKKVRNEAGKGNQVFDRATQSAVDLSAAGFGSVEGASKMLGKALNDPIKGISALGRAGVTFTADQKKQIKTLVDSGKTLEAQKIILGEVETQVGGVAAANASMGDKVKVAIGNIKESVGTALLPVLDRLGKWFLEKGLPALQSFGGWLSDKLWPALKEGWKTILPGVQQALSIVTGGVGEGTVSWKKIGDVITTKVIPFLATLIRVYLPVLATNIRTGIEVVKKLYGAFQTWRSIVSSVISFVLRKFADLSEMWAGVLRALGKVPGFGWATDAANKLQGAADKANNVARAIDNIERDVKIKVGFQTSGRIKMPDGSLVNIAARATGGPVSAGRLYQVGDNPDGSWNSTTEILRSSGPGRVINQDEMRRAMGVSAAPTGTGKVDFSEATLQRLAALLSQVRTSATVSVSSLDAAMGGSLR